MDLGKNQHLVAVEEETDDPLTESELAEIYRRIEDPTDESIQWEEACRELGLDDDSLRNGDRDDRSE